MKPWTGPRGRTGTSAIKVPILWSLDLDLDNPCNVTRCQMKLRLSGMDVWVVPSNIHHNDGADWDVVPSTLRNNSQRLTFDLQGDWAKLCHLGSILILKTIEENGGSRVCL